LTALWLFGASFRVVLCAPVTSFLAESTVNDSLSPLEHSQLVEVANIGRAFVTGQRDAELPKGDDERVSFPPEAVEHMEDVRAVLQGVRGATWVLTALLLAAVVLSWRTVGRETVGRSLFAGGIAAVVVALLLTVCGVLSFEALFTALHRLFFAEGTWVFAVDSLLICAYPLTFWIGMGIIWALALIFLSTFLSTVGFVLKRPSQSRSPRSRSETN
jgi:integral membrane protein (TIGR01906 family)